MGLVNLRASPWETHELFVTVHFPAFLGMTLSRIVQTTKCFVQTQSESSPRLSTRDMGACDQSENPLCLYERPCINIFRRPVSIS